MNRDKDAIERLHRDLPIIRTLAGWSAEHLASLLGVSRVTVVNLENNRGKMSMIQYLAIRALLQEEIVDNDNQTLGIAIDILVERDGIPESTRQEIRDSITNASKRISRKFGSIAIGLEAEKSVKQTLGEMPVDEISDDLVSRGKATIDALLSHPVNTLK